MITIGGRDIELDDFRQIVLEEKPVGIADQALDRVQASFDFLLNFSKDKVIYGINTGFGPMAQFKVADENQVQLQYNLIRSHAAGAGNTLPDQYVKCIMLARLNTLIKGYSGVHPDIVRLLHQFINKGIYPQIFEHGGVGASGDLVQLAHVALGLLGEGQAYWQRQTVPMQDALAQNNLQPCGIHLREGLAILNGTSAMTGIGMLNILRAENLMKWSVLASSMINEVVEAFNDHYSEELNRVKRHRGQNWVAARMREILDDSRLVKRRPDHLYNQKIERDVMEEKVQEYYSIRCVPQILGPVKDCIEQVQDTLLNEVNSVNDNPIVDHQDQNVYHGGNFHGDYVALEMDRLKTAIIKLSMLADRQLNFLMNDKLNNKFPPFVNLGQVGLNYGMQGAQFTATSTVAENQSLGSSVYIHSIPSNNDNQDIVSMGANAAWMTKKVIDNSYEVLAIEFLAILQAVDALGNRAQLSTLSHQHYEALRSIVPVFQEDFVKHNDIRNIKEYLVNHRVGFDENGS